MNEIQMNNKKYYSVLLLIIGIIIFLLGEKIANSTYQIILYIVALHFIVFAVKGFINRNKALAKYIDFVVHRRIITVLLVATTSLGYLMFDRNAVYRIEYILFLIFAIAASIYVWNIEKKRDKKL